MGIMSRMRIRDSGMPDETFWELMFDVPLILARLEIKRFHDVAEVGCGFGTFSIPVARAVPSTLFTFVIDPAMVARTKQRGAGARDWTVRTSRRGNRAAAMALRHATAWIHE